MKFIGCPTCDYVRGATTGYDPLTPDERKALENHGYLISENVLGDEVAGLPKHGVSVARGVYHEVMCRRPPRFERDILPERKQR